MVLCAAALTGAPAQGSRFDDWSWRQLPNLPVTLGVGGAFAGVSGGALIVAGGSYFPTDPPWQGGQKHWCNDVWILPPPDRRNDATAWRSAAERLPQPSAYGVSATYGGAMLCVGGCNGEKYFADCFRLDWDGRRVKITKLAALPRPLANACGAVVGDTLFVAGGERRANATDASREVFSLDLRDSAAVWHVETPLPGVGRTQAVAAACDGSFWVVGGTSFVANSHGGVCKRWLRDGYRLRPDRTWTRIADMPRPANAAPSPAPTCDAGFFVLGGSDGPHDDVPPAKHPGFAKTVLMFDVQSGQWREGGRLPASRVTTPTVRWADAWVIPCGECRPGVRSPEIWTFQMKGSR